MSYLWIEPLNSVFCVPCTRKDQTWSIKHVHYLLPLCIYFIAFTLNTGWDVIDHGSLVASASKKPNQGCVLNPELLLLTQLPLSQDNDIPVHKGAMMLLVLNFFHFIILFSPPCCAFFWMVWILPARARRPFSYTITRGPARACGLVWIWLTPTKLHHVQRCDCRPTMTCAMRCLLSTVVMRFAKDSNECLRHSRV